MFYQNLKALRWMSKYLRYVDYIGAAQLYLKDNFLLREPLKQNHFKPRILGHWGTVPGLNFIYANLNYLAYKHECEMMLVTGPGHGAPAILANLFAEGTLEKFYPDFTVDGKGMGRLIHDFSWPHTKFPSHVTPTVPGSILEGGELGYSLSTAYGAVMDNPNLIVAAVIGDGESETGPIATAWHSNKFLNPATSGAVLPIVHVNGYKISNPTLFGTMSNDELNHLFKGYGYIPFIVEGPKLERKMLKTMEKAYQLIRAVQKKARTGSKEVLKPQWPVIILRSTKGWTGVKTFHGHPVEGSFRSHGIPLENPQTDFDQFKAVEAWLQSYRVNELLDEKGKPLSEVTRFLPSPTHRLGRSKHAIGGNLRKALKLPKSSTYSVSLKERGKVNASSMGQGAKWLRDLFRLNPTNFRVFCPDEMESNKLGGVFEQTKRAYVWPIPQNAEQLAPEGRVMEMLSEHTLQGWLQGYLLTGRHGLFVTYEAFATIICSMVDQYAKFLKQSFRVEWRKPVAAANYLLTSVGWRQDHNGYSHQNPSFVSNVLQKHGEFCQIYYPADANSLLVTLEEVFKKTNSINVIVSGKRDLPQWLSLEEARKQAKEGMGIWEWVGGKVASKNPDVVLASAGDYITEEALFAVKLCRELVPELKIRYVNVSELTSLCLGDYHPHREFDRYSEDQVHRFFTKDKPVVFNYHGYVTDVEHVLWPYATSDRFSIHGYREKGSTTTPFDLKVANGVSCYQIAMDLIEQAARRDKALARKKSKLVAILQKRIDEHQVYIALHGDDPDYVKQLKW